MSSVDKINADTGKIREMAKDLKNMALSCDAKEDDNEDDSKSKEDAKKADKDEESGTRTRYEEALYCLTDPLLPVRGHGLIELTRLIKEKDAQTVKHVARVLDIFRVNKYTDLLSRTICKLTPTGPLLFLSRNSIFFSLFFK